jgi:hypothetical protein
MGKRVMDRPMSAGTHRPAGGERPEPFEIASTAPIAGHPIHPMLVPFLVAFLNGALLADLASYGPSIGGVTLCLEGREGVDSGP